VLAAQAERAGRVDHGVADLPGHPAVAAPGFAVQDPAAAYPGADGDVEQAAAAAPGAKAVFAQGGRIGVVVDARRRAELLPQQ